MHGLARVMAAVLLVATPGAFAASATAGTTGPAASKVVLGEPVDLEYGGVKMPLPKDFQILRTREPFDLVRAARMEKSVPVIALTLSAFTLPETATLDGFIEATQPNKLDIRDFKVIKKIPAEIDGLKAEIRLISYTFQGQEVTAFRTYFLRPAAVSVPAVATQPAGGAAAGRPASTMVQFQLGYALTVECDKEHGPDGFAVLSAVIKAIDLKPPRHPSLDVTPGIEEVSRRLGYSIRPPEGWKVVPSPDGVVMFQTDYLLGGQNMPMAVLMPMPTEQDAAAAVARSIKNLKDVVATRHHELTIQDEAPAKMGGAEGRQFLAREEIPPAEGGGQVLIGQRIVVRAGRAHSLMIVARCDSKSAAGLLDAIAATVKLSDPTTTEPAAQK